MDRITKYIPNSLKDLSDCLYSRVCMTKKANLLTHAYISKEWTEWNKGVISKLKCVMNDFQEPYVMLKRSSTTPLFDERFVNYGYNKVQLVEHLRYQGMISEVE